MEANLILKGFLWFFHYEVFSKSWKPAKTIIIIRWIMMQRHQILGLRQFFVWAAPSGYHQTYIGRAMGQSGKKEAMIRR